MRRVVLLLDCLVVTAAALAVAIVLTGGFFSRSEGVRISARSPDRAILAGAGLLALRLALDRRSGFLARDRRFWLRARARLYAPALETAAGSLWGSHVWKATVGLAVMGVVLLHAQLRHMGSVPDLGDPLFSIWRIGWIYRQLLGDPRSLFDANIFHPEPLTLTLSDAMLLPAVMAAPLLAAGLHPAVAYNALFLSGFLLSGLGAYLLVFRLTGSARGAFLAAVIFAFHPYRFEHYSHLELQMTQWMPLCLLAVHRFTDTGRLRDAVLASLAWVAQLYSSLYYGVFFGLYALVVFAVLVWSGRRGLRALVGPVLTAGALAGLLAVPLARPYLAAQSGKGARDVPTVQEFSAEPVDYLRAHHRSARYGDALVPGRKPERALFPGLMALALTAVALVPPVGRLRLAYLAGLLVAFDGSLGFNGILYPWLYDWFLPIQVMRVPARFSIIVGLSLAILSGFGAARSLSAMRPPGGRILFAVLLLAAALDLQPVLRLMPVWRQPPPVYASITAAHTIVLAEFPHPREVAEVERNLAYMYFSVWHGASMVNGYSGFIPRTYPDLIRGLAGFPDDEALEELARRGVTHVTVHCAFYGNRCESILERLDGMPVFRPVVQARWLDRPVHLYEFRAQGTAIASPASRR